MVVDPEDERWQRKYPRFPGVAKCVELLKRRNVQGLWIDIICCELEKHAADNIDELLAAARADENSSVRLILLDVIENVMLPQAIPLFVELLSGPDPAARQCAIRGLRRIDTKESRRELWKAGVSS